jgi:hypothetical protein
MARQQYIVHINDYEPLAVGSLTDATKLVQLLAKMNLVQRDYGHPEDSHEAPVYRRRDARPSMDKIRLVPVPASSGEPARRRVAATIRALPAGQTLLPEPQRRLPGGGG